MAEYSGRHWVSRFPTSTSVADLMEPFRTGVSYFLTALAGAWDSTGNAPSVHVSGTFRPPERAYLMRGAYQIAHRLVAPFAVLPMPGVDINWTHGGDDAAAIAAAEDMVAGYGIAFAPSGTISRHCERGPGGAPASRAIDMTILWKGTLNIRNATGTLLAIGSAPHDGTNPDLAKIGASYGVIKLPTDRPHWSADGH